MNKKYIKHCSIFVVLFFSAFLLTQVQATTLKKFDKDVVDVLNDTSKVLLSFAGGLALLFLVFGGVYYILSGANPEGQETAKKTIKYALMGIGIVLLSYAVITAIEKIGT